MNISIVNLTSYINNNLLCFTCSRENWMPLECECATAINRENCGTKWSAMYMCASLHLVDLLYAEGRRGAGGMLKVPLLLSGEIYMSLYYFEHFI